MKWKRKDLVALGDLSKEEILCILETAKTFKQAVQTSPEKIPSLRSKTVMHLFVEPSTRTRVSFELAAQRLSANSVSLDAGSSSFTKGETLKDTALNLQALNADFIVLRHKAAGSSQFLAERLKASVVNAGDGSHEHPTQGLLDVFTLCEKWGNVKDRNVVIVGDILFSRVARSNIWALLKLGANVTLVGPTTLLPDIFREMGVRVARDLEQVLPSADAINLLRIQHERQQKTMFPSLAEYISFFGLDMARFNMCKPSVVIMHPGPVNRGVELASELADGVNSVILEQVTNGLAVRMAVFHLLNGGGPLDIGKSGKGKS